MFSALLKPFLSECFTMFYFWLCRKNHSIAEISLENQMALNFVFFLRLPEFVWFRGSENDCKT